MYYRHWQNEETRKSVLGGIRDPQNAAGWNRFYELYAGYIYSIARSRGLSDADADDVVSAVMTSIVEGIGKYDPARGKFRGWLYNLTAWRVNDVFRSKSRTREIPLAPEDMPVVASDEPVVDDEAEWAGAVNEEALRRLKAVTNPTHFAVFHASVFEELDVESIKNLYGVTRDNIYQIKKRVKAEFTGILAAVAREMESPALPRAS